MTPAPAHSPLERSEIMSIILGLLLAMLLAALDQTIVATAMPTIGRELHDIENLPWIVTAYLLSATAVTPLYGKLSDIHGRRIMLLWGIGIFIVGSIACALAPSLPFLAVARGIQGAGGGGLISLAQTIIGDMVSPRERAQYQVYIASVFVTSSIAGPVLGGFFAQHMHWSMIFWINLPLGLAAFLMTNSKLKKLPRFERPHKLDIAGAIIMIAATTSLLLALSWGGVRHGWNSPPIVALLIASALLWALFFWRIRTADEPLIPMSVLRNKVVLWGVVCAAFSMGTFIGLCIYMPLYFEGVTGLSASNSGVALIPLMVGTVTGATISGRAMPHAIHYKTLPIIGLSVSIVAMLVISFWATSLPLVLMEVLLATISLGLGTCLPVTTVCIQNAVSPHELGTATASMNFFRQLGGAIIVAAFGAIVIGAASAGHPGASLESLRVQSLDPQLLADAFHRVFLGAAFGLGMALLALIALEERPLHDRRHTPEDEPGA